MLDKKFLIMAVGGLALAAVAVTAIALTVRKQAGKLRANMRNVSRSVYNFGTALQLLSGAGAEDDCEICTNY